VRLARVRGEHGAFSRRQRAPSSPQLRRGNGRTPPCVARSRREALFAATRLWPYIELREIVVPAPRPTVWHAICIILVRADVRLHGHFRGFAKQTDRQERQMERNPQDNVIVVTEHGSEWPGWLTECSPCGSGSRVIVQEEGESLADLAQRVCDRCNAPSNPRPARAVIACSERSDESAFAARRSIARALLSVLGHASGARLLLTASERSSGLSRRALSDFAAVLAAELDESGPLVSVRFGSAYTSVRPASGVHAA